VDGRFRRRVALKLACTAWDHSFSERLNRERNILGSLEHPHIARFLDAGQDKAGRPCLALEHADGQAIDAYGEEHRLGIRERLRLLLQVCEAVAYAHTQLVIHRDLKPADILVTPQGQVKLLDFGIAKLMEGDRTSETALTALSRHVLTLDSASPEQTGARPHRLRRGSAAELEEAIAHADAPRASDVATERDVTKAFRGDLDAILDKALRKRTADRYLNVESLADDLLRHLDHVPVQARPPSRWYLARRYATRHRTAVAAATGIMLALGIGLGPSLWQATRPRATNASPGKRWIANARSRVCWWKRLPLPRPPILPSCASRMVSACCCKPSSTSSKSVSRIGRSSGSTCWK